jgi:hypothetical protein
VLAHLWIGSYDITEELITSDTEDSPLASPTERVQINVRRVTLPWLGTHVLYVEEFPYDEPFEVRRRVLLSIESERGTQGELRVRQFTRKTEASQSAALAPADIESVAGCDIFLKREGAQFRGGTQGRHCLETDGSRRRWIDYRVVIGDRMFWYRKRSLTLPDDEVVLELAGFPHADFDEARLFSCGISWAASKDRVPRRPIEGVDLHDRGGRARFRTPDGRELTLELHGRDWPLSEGRESLILILTDGRADGETIASSWTSLGAARVGIDIGWLAIDCAPVVSETGEKRS